MALKPTINIQQKESAITEFVKQLPGLILQYQQNQYNLIQSEKSRQHESKERRLDREARADIASQTYSNQEEENKRTHNTSMQREYGLDNIEVDKNGYYQTKSSIDWTKTPDILKQGDHGKIEAINLARVDEPRLPWSDEEDSMDHNYQILLNYKSGLDMGRTKAKSGTLSKQVYVSGGAIDILPGMVEDRDLEMIRKSFDEYKVFDAGTEEKDISDTIMAVMKDLGILKPGESFDDRNIKNKLESRWVGFENGVRNSDHMVGASEYNKYRTEEIAMRTTMASQMQNTAAVANENLNDFESRVTASLTPDAEGNIHFRAGDQIYDLSSEKGLRKLREDGFTTTATIVNMLVQSDFSVRPTLDRFSKNAELMRKLREENPDFYSQIVTGIDYYNEYKTVIDKSRQFTEDYEPKDEEYVDMVNRQDNFSAFLANETNISSLVNMLLNSKNPLEEDGITDKLIKERAKYFGTEWYPYIEEYFDNVSAAIDLGR